MNIDLLIKMTNEIGEFFAGADSKDPEAAARDVANHLKRYWDPRMRRQMLKYYEERGGAGLRCERSRRFAARGRKRLWDRRRDDRAARAGSRTVCAPVTGDGVAADAGRSRFAYSAAPVVPKKFACEPAASTRKSP